MHCHITMTTAPGLPFDLNAIRSSFVVRTLHTKNRSHVYTPVPILQTTLRRRTKWEPNTTTSTKSLVSILHRGFLYFPTTTRPAFGHQTLKLLLPPNAEFKDTPSFTVGPRSRGTKCNYHISSTLRCHGFSNIFSGRHDAV